MASLNYGLANQSNLVKTTNYECMPEYIAYIRPLKIVIRADRVHIGKVFAC